MAQKLDLTWWKAVDVNYLCIVCRISVLISTSTWHCNTVTLRNWLHTGFKPKVFFIISLEKRFRVSFCLLTLTPVHPGEHAELQRQESADGHSFQQGDKVKCLLEVDILRQMQEGHGGWNPKMAEVQMPFARKRKNLIPVDNRQL